MRKGRKMSVKVSYGVDGNYVDITQKAFEKCYLEREKKLIIPKDDNLRAFLFGDPCYGVVKHIMTVKGICKLKWKATEDVIVNVKEGEIPEYVRNPKIGVPDEITDAEQKLRYLHTKLRITGGSLVHEWNEQMMVANYLPKDAKVLELGSNIGRNTLILASLLNDDKNLVTMESDPRSVEVLKANRTLNSFQFGIEDSALSYQKLIQKDWVTIPSNEVLDGYFPVKTMTFEEVERKHKMQFNVIVADCEGALYYILQDRPTILKNIEWIFLESDFFKEEHKEWVMQLFAEYGLERIYSEALIFDPKVLSRSVFDKFPKNCQESFYEVWRKKKE